MHDWINPSYLDPLVQSEIQTKFETDSEIELTKFLLPDKLQAVKEALQSEGVLWNKRGPPNKRWILENKILYLNSCTFPYKQ